MASYASLYIPLAPVVSPFFNFFSHKVDIKGSSYLVEMRCDLDKLSYKPKYIKFNAFRHERVGNLDKELALSPTLCETFHVREKFIEFE